jgi:hypothetical protein
MILEEKVEVKYSGKNIPILKSKGYLDLKQGQLVEVRIDDLSIKLVKIWDIIFYL